MSYSVVASPIDLDSLASVYMIKRVLKDQIREVKFLSHQEIENTEADFLVDTPHGKARVYRFDHHDTSEATCSAMKVVDYFKLGYPERRFAEAVCWQDNAGWKILTRAGMDNLLDTSIKAMEYTNKKPEEILEFFSNIFDALLLKFQRDYEILNEVEKQIKYNSQGIMLVLGDYPKDLLFQEFNPNFLIKYHDNSFSITRNAKIDKPNLYKFKEFLKEKNVDTNGWFFHPQGFFVGFQGNENKRPPVDSQQLLNLLLEFVKLNQY